MTSNTAPDDVNKQHVCSNLAQKTLTQTAGDGQQLQILYECLECAMMFLPQEKQEKGENTFHIGMTPIGTANNIELKGLLSSAAGKSDEAEVDHATGEKLPANASTFPSSSQVTLGSSQVTLGSSQITLERGNQNAQNQHAQPNWFSCKKCPNTVLFTSQNSLNDHYKTVHNVVLVEDTADAMQFRCWTCEKNFSSQTELTSHKESNKCYDEKMERTCDICTKTFQNIDEETYISHVLSCSRLHLSTTSSATQFECSLCKFTFTKQQQLVEHHRKNHMGDKVFRCNFCNAKFSWLDNLEKHAKIHEHLRDNSSCSIKEHTRVLCPVCSNPFHSVVSLSSHMSLSHPHHPLTLDGSWGMKPGTEVSKPRSILPLKTETIKLVDSGSAIDFDTDLSEFVAELAASNNKRKLDDDANSQPNEKILKTEDFEIIDATNNQNDVIIEEEVDLGVHRLVNAVAAQNDPHSLYCNLCEKTYQNPDDESIASSMNLRCTYCGWKFQQPYQLEAHLDHLHSLHIRLSICQLCQAELKSNTAMDKHYASVHSNSRSFHCYQCDSHFNTKSCLRGHLLRHQQTNSNSNSFNASSEQQHVCPHCNMRYAHAHQLLTHVTKSHPTFAPRPPSLLGASTGGAGSAPALTVPIPGAAGLGNNTQFVCGFCSKRFAYEGSLKIHLKSHEEKIKAQMFGLDNKK